MELKKIFCTVCGSNNLIEIGNIFKCNACDAQFEKQQDVSEEQVKLFSALYDAESFIRMSPPRFDFAEEKYRIIANDYPEEASAYWGLFRAKNDIKYIEGKPICYNYVDKDVKNDSDYLNALKYADDNLKQRYKEEIEKIDLNIQEWKNRASELDYDVFLSFKQTDSDGKETEDTKLVRELYTFLLENNIKTFYSPYSMKNHVGEPYYDAYIYNALSKSQVLFIYGSDPKYFDSDWVKCEWTRYLNMISKKLKRDDSLLISFSEFDAEQLPRELRNRQAYNSNSRTMFNDIFNKIYDILHSIIYKQNGLSRIDKPELIKYDNTQIVEKINKKEIGLNTSIKDDTKLNVSLETRKTGRLYSNSNVSQSIEERLNRVQSFINYEKYDMAKNDLNIASNIDKNNPRVVLYDLLIENNCKELESLLSREDILSNELILDKIKYVIEYSSKEKAEEYLNTLSNIVLNLINNKQLKLAEYIFKNIVDYDSKIIKNLREQVIISISKAINIQTLNNPAISMIDTSLEYIYSDKDPAKKLLVLVIESNLDYNKLDIVKYYFNKLSSIDHSFDVLKYDILLKYNVLSLNNLFDLLSKNNFFEDYDSAITNADLNSALEMLKCEKDYAFNNLSDGDTKIYNIIKNLLQYDFDEKDNFLSYVMNYITYTGSNKFIKTFDIVFSYFMNDKNKFDNNTPVKYEKNNFVYISKGSNNHYNLYAYIGSLFEIKINEDVKIISEKAFLDNEYLEKIIIPKNVEKIGKQAFANCTYLKEVQIDNKDIIVEEGAFNNTNICNLKCHFDVLTHLGLGTLKSIVKLHITKCDYLKKGILSECLNLKELIIDDVKSIEEGAFSKVNVGNVTKYKSAYYLGNNKNKYLILLKVTSNNLKNVGVHKDCKVIYGSALDNVENIFYEGTYNNFFNVSKSLNSVHLKDIYIITNDDTYDEEYEGLKFKSIFSYNNENVILSNELNEICKNQIILADMIDSLYIPKSIKKIYFSPLDLSKKSENEYIRHNGANYLICRCKFINKIYYGGDIQDWLLIDFPYRSNPLEYCEEFYFKDDNGDVVFNNEKYKLLTDIVIPEGPTTIRNYAFYGLKHRDFYLPKTIKSIGDDIVSSYGDVYYYGDLESWNKIKNIKEAFKYLDKPIRKYSEVKLDNKKPKKKEKDNSTSSKSGLSEREIEIMEKYA